MYLKSESLYVSGLVHMASFHMGPSYMEADCMSKGNYIDTFSKRYKVKKENIVLDKVEITIEKLFEEIFQIEKRALDNFIYWLEKECGRCIQIYISNNEELISSLSKGYGPFFFLESIYFIEFEKMVVCFMIGNDE